MSMIQKECHLKYASSVEFKILIQESVFTPDAMKDIPHSTNFSIQLLRNTTDIKSVIFTNLI
jgi:hypothetical protein